MNESITKDSHALIIELLPWYVNKTLGNGENERVRQHIDSCETCRDDVNLLGRIQDTIRSDSPAPLVVEPQVQKLFDAIDRPNTAASRWPLIAAAASIFVVAIVAMLTWEREPTFYETVTTSAAPGSIEYVLELRFVDGVRVDEQLQALVELGVRESATVTDPGVYRIPYRQEAPSFPQLREYVARIEALPQVDSVNVLAAETTGD